MEWKQKQVLFFDFLIPIVVLVVLTIVFWVTELDLAIQKNFFVQEEGWIYKDLHPWRFLYDYGPIPAIAVAAASLLAFIGSFWIHKITPYRKVFVFFVVLMIIGPGLVVNTVFKGYWGRPRPRHLEAFGGSESFLYVWEKGKTGEGHSFPSGHAAMGFFLFAPYFIFRRNFKRWSVLFLTVGLSAGLIIGLARMVQGGHFASDVIWSGGFVYLCGTGLSYLLRLDRV